MSHHTMRYWRNVSHADMHVSDETTPELTALIDDLMALDPAERHTTMFDLDAAQVCHFDTMTHLVHQRIVAANTKSIARQRK